VYVSDSKVDMCLAQIEPRYVRKVASELGVDVKILSVRRRWESEVGSDRFVRVEMVSRWLRDHADVGDIDEPAAYIGGTLSMRWGPFAANDELILFGGATGRTVVALAGSRKHLVGGTSGRPDAPEFSAPGPFAAALAAANQDDDEHLDGQYLHLKGNSRLLGDVHRAVNDLGGPLQTLEFLAKEAIFEPSPLQPRAGGRRMRVRLGSPIYVAQVG